MLPQQQRSVSFIRASVSAAGCRHGYRPPPPPPLEKLTHTEPPPPPAAAAAAAAADYTKSETRSSFQCASTAGNMISPLVVQQLGRPGSLLKLLKAASTSASVSVVGVSTQRSEQARIHQRNAATSYEQRRRGPRSLPSRQVQM